MKVDGLGVILAIILLPIILIVTYYIQMQVDTIAKQNQYNANLLNATYDAMSAFEMNTANEELSSVADSMRSIILASNNIFLDSLATKFGVSNASRQYIQPYIPAILYTMYDGYYVYAPTETENGLTTTKGYLAYGDTSVSDSEIEDANKAVFGDVLYEKEGGGYTVKKENAKKETDYLLKSYVQYSARYQNQNKDVTINYTLDNYLNIIGTINGIYYTKTGYLIKNSLVTGITIDDVDYDLQKGNENEIKNKILGLKTSSEATTIRAANNASVTVNGVTINSNFDQINQKINGVDIASISEAETYLEKMYEQYEQSKESELFQTIQNLEYEIQNCKAVAYYASSACFSNWVYENLRDLEYGNIKNDAVANYYKDENGNLKYQPSVGAEELYYDFSENTTKIFDQNEDPEDTESKFNTHKREVIKNSIKYNLNLAMSAYCKMERKNSYEFSLPILADEEWDKVLSNLSIVSFMQGLNCGLNIYNNYQIVSSTNNELTVTPSEIYYVKKDEFNSGYGNYHRIDCPYLAENNDGYIAFKSKEVKYDKVYDRATNRYHYDHKNLACYTCINTNNYESKFQPKTNTDYYKNGKKYTSYYDRIDSLDDGDKKKAGYIGLAKERQAIYKTNALPVSQGYQVINNDGISNDGNYTYNFSQKLQNVQKLQITFANTKSAGEVEGLIKEPVLRLQVKLNDNNGEISLNLDQKKEQTVTFDVSKISDISSIALEKIELSYSVSYQVKSIKVIYK